MRKASLVLCSVACLGIIEASPGAQGQPAAAAKVEQELIALDKRLAEAESKSDRKTVDSILAQEYTLVDQSGRTVTRAQALGVLSADNAAHHSGITTSDYTVRVYGDTAVMTHAATIKGATGAEELRTTHVWVRRDGRWQLAADHCTAIAFPQLDHKKPFLNAACSEASFAPQVHQFYGTNRSIQTKLDDVHMALEKRRVYLLLLETDTSAQLVLFDRKTADEPIVAVSHWQGRTIADLREGLTNAIMQNRGITCIGERATQLVKAKYTPREIGRIDAPVTARAAFGHLLNTTAGEYVRATVFLLC